MVDGYKNDGTLYYRNGSMLAKKETESMSVLIDNLVGREKGLYIPRPLNKQSFNEKLKDALKILKGRAIAVHYYEDELERKI